MLIQQYPHSRESSPPSSCFVFVPQSEPDRAVMAELIDIANANRAPGNQEKTGGMSGRVMVTSLAAELEIEKIASPLNAGQSKVLGELNSSFGCGNDVILKSAFHVRFFQW